MSCQVKEVSWEREVGEAGLCEREKNGAGAVQSFSTVTCEQSAPVGERMAGCIAAASWLSL